MTLPAYGQQAGSKLELKMNSIVCAIRISSIAFQVYFTHAS